MPDVKVENIDQSAFCDLTVIQPGVIRKAETKLSVLLERVLVRKELKLKMFQQRLIEQTQKLEEAEKKLKAEKNVREALESRCSCQPAVEDVSMQTGAVRFEAVRTGAVRAVSFIQGLFSCFYSI